MQKEIKLNNLEKSGLIAMVNRHNQETKETILAFLKDKDLPEGQVSVSPDFSTIMIVYPDETPNTPESNQ